MVPFKYSSQSSLHCLAGLLGRLFLFVRFPGGGMQGFMQDKIIASHTCFGRHMDVNCSASLQTFKCV